MLRLASTSILISSLLLPLAAQTPGAGAASPAQAAALPYIPSLDVNAMDRSANPCVNLYQYSCGGWQKRNPIPSDQASWSVYGKLYQDNLAFLRTILEDAAAGKASDPVSQKIGAYYGACMDEASIERAGLKPLQKDLDAIAGMKKINDLAPLLGKWHLTVASAQLLFGSGSGQDPDDSEKVIAMFDQGGLGLPDRDYYTKTDAKSVEIRQKYVEHIEKVLQLAGESAADAKVHAQTIMSIEEALAKASLTRVERRDPYKLKNKMAATDLSKLAPHFDWAAYLKASGTPKLDIVDVTAPAFFKEVDRQLTTHSLDDWKVYFRYAVVNAMSRNLSSKFVNENFEFYSKYLRGTTELQARWKRCVSSVDRQLGEALGQAYVQKTFSPELKASTVEMTKRIEVAMEQRINQLDWMSPETKKQALTKLHSIRNKVGYPDQWRDYSSVAITRDNYLGNVLNANAFESKRQWDKIGKPVDRNEWGMTPPTVNAYYDPQMNDINFPAGVLQPPLYDAKIDAAPNYGNTGSTIGHELTHGFDDEGRQFDAKGNLKDWWTKKDGEEFEKRVKCVSDQYAGYVIVDDIHINSKLTLGEDVADLGGTIIAYIAWKEAVKDVQLENRDGLTPDQRFFVGFAQWACSNERPENLRMRATVDPHSPSEYRINGVVVNMPEFAKAFGCKAGDALIKPEGQVCKVW